MDIETLRAYCLSKRFVTEGFPFDEATLVFKVAGKMFLLTGLNVQPLQFNVKCDPEKAIELRENYTWVKPGYHMSKKHWNTVVADIDADEKMLFEFIDESYQLVYQSLPAKTRKEIEE